MDTDNTPLIPAEAAAPAPSQPPAPPAEPWTVLCVDDEPSILSALKRVLRAEDCKVLQAGSGTHGAYTATVGVTMPWRCGCSTSPMPGSKNPTLAMISCCFAMPWLFRT